MEQTVTAISDTTPLLQSLKPSPRMPVLFMGHGSPMNALEDNVWRRSWQSLGAELLAREAKPQLILCISAHWLTRGGWQITGMAQPKTIHDFGGFPQELFDQQYPAPGSPAVAASLAHHWVWIPKYGVWTTAPGRCSNPCFPWPISRCCN